MENNRPTCRIVVVESSPIISSGLKTLIEQNPGCRVVRILPDCDRHAERVAALRPDIVIVNPLLVNYKRRNCLEEAFPGLTETKFAALVYQYVDPGALKNYPVVIDIADDETKIFRKLQQALDNAGNDGDSPEAGELSDREKEILVAIAKGMTNKEIADRFSLSVHTVITHRKNIIRKTGIRSISGLTVFAILNNLVNMNEIE